MANPRCYIDTKTVIKTRVTKRRREAARIQHSNPKPIATKNETNKKNKSRRNVDRNARVAE